MTQVALPLAATVDCVALTYHTDGPTVHLEGDTYTVSDRALAETVFGIGFVDLMPTPAPPVATGAIAGAPGTWTPPGATAPATLAAMSSVTATPATAWTTGQHMVLGDASTAHWTGTAWAAGNAS